jgi:hypothetical protein
MGYQEFTPEDADASIFKGQPSQQIIGQDLVVKSNAPIVPGAVQRQPKPKQAQAAAPSVEDVTSSVIAANKQVQQNMPKPEPASAVDELVRQATSNWATLLPLAIPALAYGVHKIMGGDGGGKPPTPPDEGGGLKSPADRSMSKSMQIDRTVDIPMDSPVQPSVKPDPVAQAQQRLADTQKVMEMKGPAPVPQPPVQGIQPPVTPTVTEAVALGESPTKAIQADLAPLVDEAAPAKSAPPPAEKSVQGRVRRTAEQIAADLQASLASAPEGELPTANRKTNKLLPTDVVGQGGWHWFKGQGGDRAEWERVYGRTNQPYSRVVSDVKGGLLSVPPPVEGKKGGTIPREPTVPNYIKGAIKPEMALNLAGNAIGAVGLGQAFKHAQKTGDWSDFGLGLAGQILGNVAPRAGIAFGLMAPGQLASGTLDSPEARALGVAPR